MQQQLLDKDFEQAEVDAAIQWALELGYLDDKRLAESILRSQLNKLHGPAKVVQAMQVKGIGKSLAADVIATQEIDWFALALCRTQKKFSSLALSSDFQEKQNQKAKVVRHLLGQGFNYEQAGYAVESLLAAMHAE